MPISRIALSVLTALCLLTPAFAQRGDRKGHVMKEVWRDMNVPPAPVVPADKALGTFKIDPQFELQLVAAEPLVEDPVAIDWDADGRLYAVEMRGYMPNVDGKGEDVRNGQVVVLEDTDGDGKMDKSTVFLDKLQMPRAVCVVNGGVLVAEPPTLWFCQDTDGDLKCDKKTEVARYARQGPVEHTENGLLKALDNWIYNAKSSRRFKWTGGKLLEGDTHGRGQWGIAQDDHGRLYYNSNSSYLHADLFPAEYLMRNPNAPAKKGLGDRVVGDQSVWSIRVNPGINRGYQSSMLRKDGRLSRTTAVSGQTIYRGDAYPAPYRGNAFVPEPAGNVVSRFVLSEKDLSVRGEKQLVADRQWEKREFLSSTDERFRPVSAYTGPDGCLYIVDMYRGILQHKVYVTTFLRKQILERKLDQPVGLGRIYRVVHRRQKPGTTRPMLSDASPEQLVEHLGHDNGWYRDTAQRLLIGLGGKAPVEAIRKAAAAAREPMARIHALWTLEGLGAVDAPTVKAALQHKHPRVRIAALRVGEALFKAPSRDDLLKAYDERADDRELAVLNQLLLSLGETSDHPVAQNTMLEILEDHGDNDYLRQAALSGLKDRETALLAAALQSPGWKKPDGGREKVLRDLTAAVFRSRQPHAVAQTLTLATHQKGPTAWRQKAMLEGALAAKGKRFKTIALEHKPAALDELAKGKLADQVADMLTWKGDTKPKAVEPEAVKLTDAQKARLETGQALYMATCMACHQLHGKGQAGMAPSLVDSPWVLDDDERLIRITLNGLQGPIEVDDTEWNLVMPPLKDHPLLDDEGLSSVLTYVRRAWGHSGKPIDPDAVKKVRARYGDRAEMWTVEELRKAK